LAFRLFNQERISTAQMHSWRTVRQCESTINEYKQCAEDYDLLQYANIDSSCTEATCAHIYNCLTIKFEK